MNTDVAERGLAQIRDNPESHNQSIWIKYDGAETCGTVGCFAGHVVMQSGATLLEGSPSLGWHYVEYQGERWAIQNVAAELLGLTTAWEMGVLFNEHNTYAMLEGMVKYLSNNPATDADAAVLAVAEWNRLAKETGLDRKARYLRMYNQIDFD